MKIKSLFLVVAVGSLVLLISLLCLWLPRGQIIESLIKYADGKDLFARTSRGTNMSSGNQGLVHGRDRCQRFSGPDGHLRCAKLTPSEVKGVKHFVLFIGYSRSGHSIIGSMMDAHPNMIIAHEYFVFRKFSEKHLRPELGSKIGLFDELLDNSCSSVTSGWRTNMTMEGAVRKGYSLGLPTQWQGCFTDLKVIGDKSGGSIADIETKDPVLAKFIFRMVQELVKLPILLIHVVRNPFDMIATEVMDKAFVGIHRWDHLNNTTTKALPDPGKLKSFLKRYRQRAVSIQQVQEKWGVDILEIHHADFVHDPKSILQEICDYLHLDCPEDYLEACYNKTFRSISKTRYLMEWPPRAVREVELMIQEYPFFRRYSFDSD